MASRIMSFDGAGVATYYPARDGVGFASSTFGATTVAADSVFFEASRHAILRAIFVDYSALTPTPLISVETAAGVQIHKFLCLRATPHQFLFGPDGFQITDGFRVEIAGSAGTAILIYDVT